MPSPRDLANVIESMSYLNMLTSLWKRSGQIHIPLRDRDGSPLKFQFPTLQIRAPDRWRLFLAARGTENVGRMIFADLAPRDGMRVLDCGEVIDRSDAEPDAYDADGIGPSCVFSTGTQMLMATTGLRLRMPAYDAGVGFLHSTDGGATFQRDRSLTPFFGLPDFNFAVGPDIQKIAGRYHMWYAQGNGWRDDVKPYPEPTYYIGHATSDTGTDWSCDPTPAVTFAHPDETGITRPCVRRARGGDGWEMWYCYRRKYDSTQPGLRHYRIGYATSRDLTHWHRRDAAHSFLPPLSPSDFDGQMQCYPTVVQDNDREVMFYCGNDYGRGGVGFAERVRNQ